MLTPSAPQASISGPSPESTSVGTNVSVQATPGIPIPQVHPGDVTVVTEPVELSSVGRAGAEQLVLVESSGNDEAGDVRPSLVEPVASDGAGAEQSVLVESRAADGAGTEQSVLVWSCVAAGGADNE